MKTPRFPDEVDIFSIWQEKIGITDVSFYIKKIPHGKCGNFKWKHRIGLKSRTDGTKLYI
ncbi:hypothetical protein LPTSP3_g23980 [Leptospira kobayashii]|uniref:Uncharacterized protein n=1 Tax=Leptospira kobayashii TaxID=1917830 RepID=A0ABM7US20_9LEPT|nr:hypothetical protein LPTSP3_g23980 [Leptospira kobayashii]